MFLKPDYNLKNIYAINLEELKSKGIKNLLFDLDSTIMASKSGCYSAETKNWLEKVKKDFFIAGNDLLLFFVYCQSSCCQSGFRTFQV